MRSFSIICAVALAGGVSAQSSTSIPGGCNPAHPGSCPSSYFQTLPASSAPAASANTPAPTTTITAHAGCPTPAADVIVTRSNAPVPSCEAGNGTKASVVSMMASGSAGAVGSAGSYGSGSGNATSTGTGAPAQFTGAAGRNGVSAMLAVVGGAVVYFL